MSKHLDLTGERRVAVPINSRAKGCAGEREFRDVLRAHGFEARRGQQFAGGGDSPDVISNVPGVHWEVKRVEAGNPYVWLQQAIEDVAADRTPIVAHRRNGEDWIAILRMDDLIRLIKEAKACHEQAHPLQSISQGQGTGTALPAK